MPQLGQTMYLLKQAYTSNRIDPEPFLVFVFSVRVQPYVG